MICPSCSKKMCFSVGLSGKAYFVCFEEMGGCGSTIDLKEKKQMVPLVELEIDCPECGCNMKQIRDGSTMLLCPICKDIYDMIIVLQPMEIPLLE